MNKYKVKLMGIFLSFALNLDWPLKQLHIKNAFLNRELEKEVYMYMLSGFEVGCLAVKKVSLWP